MMILLFIFLFINNSLSSEWKCNRNPTENQDFLFTNDQIYEQCTIIVEYLSFQHDKQICMTHTLSMINLPPFSFSFNYTMQTFRINSCQLLTLNQLPFSLPSSLEKLDLSDNLFSTFILSYPLLSNLKYLQLDYNPNLIDIQFDKNFIQENLIGLSLRYNKLIQLDSLPSHLTQLDLTGCNLLQSLVLPMLRSLTKLTHLSLADNQLEQLPVLDGRVQLEYLNVSNNRLTVIEDRWLYRQLQILDLKFNQIRSLEFFKNRLKMMSNMNQTIGQNQTTVNHILQLSLHGNPLICDCWLGAILDSSLFINITDVRSLQCNSHLIPDIPRDNLLCSYSRHCAPDCSCCDFEACDCHSVCPSECLCSYNAQWSRHIVKCSKANLSNIHILLPETITELNYEDNYIEQLKPFVFVGKTLLNKLNLSKNKLRNITNETFCAASNLYQINLSQNSNFIIKLSIIDELFRCLKHLQYIILSKDQINEEEEEEEISPAWTIDSNNENIIRLKRVTQEQSSSVRSSTLPPLLESQTQFTTIFSIYQKESITTPSIIEHNQTLIITVFFLLLFVLLFLLLLISLAICRRKVRRHLTVELQRQRYLHSSLHQPSIKTTDRKGPIGVNDTFYEQLPSLSSDSELPFLYNDQKSNITNAPALPPYPPTFRQHLCCHSANHLRYTQTTNSHEYQYPTNTTTTTDYSTTNLPHQCAAVLVWRNHQDCTPHSCSAELQQCLLLNQQEQTADNNHMRRYCNNETVFIPRTICQCNGQMQNIDTYVYPHVHR